MRRLPLRLRWVLLGLIEADFRSARASARHTTSPAQPNAEGRVPWPLPIFQVSCCCKLIVITPVGCLRRGWQTAATAATRSVCPSPPRNCSSSVARLGLAYASSGHGIRAGMKDVILLSQAQRLGSAALASSEGRFERGLPHSRHVRQGVPGAFGTRSMISVIAYLVVEASSLGLTSASDQPSQTT